MKGLNLKRVVSLVILVTFLWYLSACTTRETIYHPKGRFSEIRKADKVWVTMKNGAEYEFTSIVMRGEKIVGTGIKKVPIGRPLEVNGEEIALADVQVMSIRRIDTERTLLGAAIALGITGIVLMSRLYADSRYDEGYREGYDDAEAGRWNKLEVDSCPFVYSFDGSSYILDSETYGGAPFKAAERTDYDNLDYLLPVDGKYHLKMTNELSETQYTDELKLIAVDHPKGAKVVPESYGTIHTISSPVAPFSATDFDGQDVTRIIAKKDELFWESNPFSKDPEIPDELRDGLILEFPKPPGARKAKLIANVRGTLWSAHLVRNVMELCGEGIDDWHELMNRDPKARSNVMEMLVREGLLLVKTWEGAGWKHKGHFWEVGPVIPKVQVLPLDVSAVEGERLRVKLECPVAIWMVDYVAVDYSDDETSQVKELEASEVIDQDGNDIRELLRSDDDRFYVTEFGDSANLTFHEPPVLEDFARSFILKTRGYYIIHTSREGQPKMALLNRLIEEPGALGYYSLTEFQKLAGVYAAREMK